MTVLASFLFAIMKYSSKDNFKKVYFTSQFKVQSTRVSPSRQRTWERIQEGLEGENEGGKWCNYILFKRNIF